MRKFELFPEINYACMHFRKSWFVAHISFDESKD
jgi:hypothetical protein